MAKKEDANIIDYIPYEEWELREMTKGKNREQARQSFYDALVTPGRRKIKVDGAWLIGVWKGVRCSVGEADERSEEVVRGMSASSATDFQDAEALRQEAARERAAWLAELRDQQTDGQTPQGSVDVDDRLVEAAPAKEVPQGSLVRDMQRDFHMNQQRLGMQTEYEEQDTFQAMEAAKLAKAAARNNAGRPKKTTAEMLNDASTIIRNRKASISATLNVSNSADQCHVHTLAVRSSA